ncbi:hypothetical protein HanHA89_Chr17g0694781 [Helianthus annuus]|nr:hypothetical protein HanHA89_Chr17g0694781 [Helianthus annuus]
MASRCYDSRYVGEASTKYVCNHAFQMGKQLLFGNWFYVPLVLISVTISLPLSENHLTTSIAVFSLKTLFAKGVSNHLHLFSTSCHKIRVVFRIFTYSFAVLRLSSTRWVNARPSPTLVNKLSTPSFRRATARHVKVTIGKLQLFTGSTGSKG